MAPRTYTTVGEFVGAVALLFGVPLACIAFVLWLAS